MADTQSFLVCELLISQEEVSQMVGVSGLWCAGTESVWFGTRCLLAAGPLCYGCAAVCLPEHLLSNSSPEVNGECVYL